MDQQTEKDTTERITGLGRRTREDIAKGIKWQPWDSRQGGDIKHPRPPGHTNHTWSWHHSLGQNTTATGRVFATFKRPFLTRRQTNWKSAVSVFLKIFLLYISVYFISVDKMRDDSSSLCPIELPFRSSTVDNYRFFVRHAMTKQSQSLAVLCSSWYVQRASVLRSWFVQQVDH